MSGGVATPSPSRAVLVVWLLILIVGGGLIALVVFVVNGQQIGPEGTAALIGATIAGSFALGQTGIGFVERREAGRIAERERRESYVFQALQHFTGHSQPRSVGISVLEGSWDSLPELRPMLVPLLCNQAIYLIRQSGQEDAAHEVDNLHRILELLIRTPRPDPALGTYYANLQKSLGDRIAKPPPPQAEAKVQKGLWFTKEQIDLAKYIESIEDDGLARSPASGPGAG